VLSSVMVSLDGLGHSHGPEGIDYPSASHLSFQRVNRRRAVNNDLLKLGDGKIRSDGQSQRSDSGYHGTCIRRSPGNTINADIVSQECSEVIPDGSYINSLQTPVRPSRLPARNIKYAVRPCVATTELRLLAIAIRISQDPTCVAVIWRSYV
jgi:hypothetical protein